MLSRSNHLPLGIVHGVVDERRPEAAYLLNVDTYLLVAQHAHCGLPAVAHVEVDMLVAHDERLASLGISQLRQLADGIPLPQSPAQEAVGHSREQPALRALELHGLLPALRRKGSQCLVEVHFREVVVQI